MLSSYNIDYIYVTFHDNTFIYVIYVNNMAKRKIGNSHTTICITWADKDQFRKFAQLVKKTKNGDMYESDSAIFTRMLESFKQKTDSNVAHDTYPRNQEPNQHD